MTTYKISELTAAAAITGAELLETSQGGNSRKTTAVAVATYVLGGGTPPAGAGTAGQVLTSAGPAVPATWETPVDTGVVGSTGATDNALLRADGTGGNTLQNSGVVVDDNGLMSGHGVKATAQAGTTYTLAATDAGKAVDFSNAGAITLTLPLNATVALPVGFTCLVTQLGAGQITFSPAGGVTMTSPGTTTKTNLQYSAVTVRKTATNTWILNGDLA